jgi:hypothetical protein
MIPRTARDDRHPGAIQPEESAPHRPWAHRQHLRSAGNRPRPRFRLLHAGAVAVSAAALAVAAVAVGTHYVSSSSRPAAEAAVPAPQLTQADIQQLEHLTPAEEARFDRDVDAAYGKLGLQVTLGTASDPVVGQTSVTAYDWSGGVQWDHVWVTASYANLEPIANNMTAVVTVGTAFCARLPGYYGIGCTIVGGLLADYFSHVHVTNWSGSHGVWAAYYWLPYGYETGGTW